MQRIDVHAHFLPGIDDGCRDDAEALECLRTLVANGYDRAFCTPHWEFEGFRTLDEVAGRVARLQEVVTRAGVPMELRPGGELRLSVNMAEELRATGIPTYGHAGRYVLIETWAARWEPWKTRAVEWLQKQGLTPILAHPERMPVLRGNPQWIEELARMGLKFQGNLGPLGGGDSADIVALAERYLQEGRYFILGTDTHRPNTLAIRMTGLQRAEALVGQAVLQQLTAENPGKLWATI